MSFHWITFGIHSQRMKPNKTTGRFHWKKLLQYFLQGLVILAPIAITVWAILSLFNFIDGILPNIIDAVAPNLLHHDTLGNPKRIPGLGFVVVILLVFGVGYVSSFFVVGKAVDLFDSILEKTPGIKFIYSSVKDFFEAFAGNKKKFDKAVLVSIHASDVWQVGFITQEEVSQFDLQDYITVYVPQSYAFAGHLYFVKKERVRLLTDISSGDAMKFAISGGVTEVEDEDKHHVET